MISSCLIEQFVPFRRSDSVSPPLPIAVKAEKWRASCDGRKKVDKGVPCGSISVKGYV